MHCVVGSPDKRRDQREGDGDQGVAKARAHDGNHDDGHQQGGDGEQGIEQVVQHARFEPLAHAAKDADGRTHYHGDHHHDEGAAEGEPRADHQPGEDIPSQIVGAEEEVDIAVVGPGGGQQQMFCVLLIDAVGHHQRAEQGDDQQQQKAPQACHGKRIAAVGGPRLLQRREDLELGIDVRFILHRVPGSWSRHERVQSCLA